MCLSLHFLVCPLSTELPVTQDCCGYYMRSCISSTQQGPGTKSVLRNGRMRIIKTCLWRTWDIKNHCSPRKTQTRFDCWSPGQTGIWCIQRIMARSGGKKTKAFSCEWGEEETSAPGHSAGSTALCWPSAELRLPKAVLTETLLCARQCWEL